MGVAENKAGTSSRSEGYRDLPPVPGSDVEEEFREGEPDPVRSRSRPGRNSRQDSLGMIFATPASWETIQTTGQSGSERRGKGGQRPGLRTEGQMRMEEEESQKDKARKMKTLA